MDNVYIYQQINTKIGSKGDRGSFVMLMQLTKQTTILLVSNRSDRKGLPGKTVVWMLAQPDMRLV